MLGRSRRTSTPSRSTAPSVATSQVQDVESFGRGIGDEASIRPRAVTYHFKGLRGLPRVTVDGRQPVRAGGRRQGEESGAGPAGEGATSGRRRGRDGRPGCRPG